jgi:actin-related protein
MDPEDHAVLLTDSLFLPKSQREKTIEIFFETLKVPITHISNQLILSLYASGRQEVFLYL